MTSKVNVFSKKEALFIVFSTLFIGVIIDLYRPKTVNLREFDASVVGIARRSDGGGGHFGG